MVRRSSEEKRAFWQMVVQMQEESGLSVRRFCEREGVGQASFFGWRRKFRAEAVAEGGRSALRPRPAKTRRARAEARGEGASRSSCPLL